MTQQLPLKRTLVRQVEAHWRQRQWIVVAALFGLTIAGFGAVSYASQWAKNDRVAEVGIALPATIYQSDSGRAANVHVQYDFDGRSYREIIQSGFFSRMTTTRGDNLAVIIDPAEPSFARTPGLRNIDLMPRLLMCITPFALLGAWFAFAAWHIRGRLNDATWFRGEFEILRGAGLRATLWDEQGEVLHTQNKMQGRVRSGRPRRGCYFAQVGRFVMVIQDFDTEGVLVPHKGDLPTEFLTPATVVDTVNS